MTSSIVFLIWPIKIDFALKMSYFSWKVFNLLFFYQERKLVRYKGEYDEIRASTCNTEKLLQVNQDEIVISHSFVFFTFG